MWVMCLGVQLHRSLSELELQAVVNLLACVVGTKLGLSARALNRWTASLVSKLVFKIGIKVIDVYLLVYYNFLKHSLFYGPDWPRSH